MEFESAFYHITSRGNLRDSIFFDDKDREKFLDIVRRTKESYGYLFHAYALMENHYYLFLETPKVNISQIMQNINAISLLCRSASFPITLYIEEMLGLFCL